MNKKISKLFKPYFVKRRNGQCQILFALTELDALIERIVLVVRNK